MATVGQRKCLGNIRGQTTVYFRQQLWSVTECCTELMKADEAK